MTVAPTNARRRLPLLAVLTLVALLSASVRAVVPVTQPADNPEHVTAFKNTKRCDSCDLRNAQLAGIQAPGAQLINADLSDATLYGGNLRGADLTGALLDRTNLEMVDLTGAVGAVLASARTDERTKCPDGSAGPCS